MLKKKVSSKIVALVFGIIVICFAVAVYVSAWTEPTTVPPGANVDAPLNVSGEEQVKVGGLILNTGGAANGLAVAQGNVGIGTLTPLAKLNVDPHGLGGIVIGNPNTGAGGYTSLYMRISAESGGYGIIQAIKSSGSEWGYLALNPSGGDVGIGNLRYKNNCTITIIGVDFSGTSEKCLARIIYDGITHDFGTPEHSDSSWAICSAEIDAILSSYSFGSEYSYFGREPGDITAIGMIKKCVVSKVIF